MRASLSIAAASRAGVAVTSLRSDFGSSRRTPRNKFGANSSGQSTSMKQRTGFTGIVTSTEASVVVLRVDDEEAGRSDHEVVDVPTCARDATVVQGDDVGQAGDRLG